MTNVDPFALRNFENLIEWTFYNLNFLLHIITFTLFAFFSLFVFCMFIILVDKPSICPKREFRISIAFFSLLLFVSFLCYGFCIFSIYLLIPALIGGIIAYWRYELSKYNKVARRALSDLTRIFQSEKLKKQHRQEISCILMTLATFNTTYAWIESKWIINRFLGLEYHKLGFRHKTPRYFEELTKISEAINRDNGIIEMVSFLPFLRTLVEDRYYKEWLDLALELIVERFEKDSLLYKLEKTWCLLKKYIEFGGIGIFDDEIAKSKFKNFLRRNGFQDIYKHKDLFFLRYSDIQYSDIKDHLIKIGELVKIEESKILCSEKILEKMRDFLIKEKECCPEQFENVKCKLYVAGILESFPNLSNVIFVLEAD